MEKPKVVGDHIMSRSTLPPGATLSPVAIVVRTTEKSSLAVTMLSTAKMSDPELKPTVRAVFVVLSPMIWGINPMAE